MLPPPIGETLDSGLRPCGASDEPEKLEYTLGAEDSERFYEACIVRCDGDKILSIVRDITDRKRAELDADAQRRELAHLSRVATLGELTGALAHELSQPLTAVLSNAQAARHLLDREPLDVAELRAALDDIIRNNKRAGAVIDRLRALLRKESTPFQPVDINDVVRDVVDLAHSEILSRRISVTSALTPAMPLVLGDRVQLQQVVLNLVLNACDAMSEADSSQRQLALATELTDGFVQLAVSDRGAGIPENQLERVFEPFVTFRAGPRPRAGHQPLDRAATTADRSAPRTTSMAARRSAASCRSQRSSRTRDFPIPAIGLATAAVFRLKPEATRLRPSGFGAAGFPFASSQTAVREPAPQPANPRTANPRTSGQRTSGLQRIPRPVLPRQELIGRLVVGDAHVRRVVVQAASWRAARRCRAA